MTEDRIMLAMRRWVAITVLFHHDVADRLGLTASDAQAMNLLDLHGPLSAGQLAELTGLTTGTVTGLIDRLEGAGYARRDRDPTDRRKVIVSLDQQRIQREVAPLYQGSAERLDDILAAYDKRALATIADFLTRISGARVDSLRAGAADPRRPVEPGRPPTPRRRRDRLGSPTA